MVVVTGTHTTEQRPPTEHEERVYKACSMIPKGKVSTYGSLAAILKSSPRAVGQALRRNPFAPEVPCHRVVSSSLQIGGFNGTWGKTTQVASKKDMLLSEGVMFDTEDTLAEASVISCTALQRTYLLNCDDSKAAQISD